MPGARLAAALAPAALLALALPAQAAFITPNEAEMESLFAGNDLDLDIRFNEPVELARPDLLAIDSEAAALELLSEAPASDPTLNMAFVDSISWCADTIDPAFIGCAVIDGNGMAIESDAAAEPSGGVLNAHELGHNYGLTHVDDGVNLMDPTISTTHTLLTSSQIQTIEASSFTQTDTGGLFTEITPLLVTPEPATAPLVGLGLVAVASRRRRVFA